MRRIMQERSVFALVGAVAVCFTAMAQEPPPPASGPVDPALLAQGQALFTSDNTACAACHQLNGEGIPPDFPALAGNDGLADTTLIVRNIHRGAGAMPAFPSLTPEEIAALATYVRNSWGNGLGGVGSQEVSDILAALPPPVDQASVWEGVFSEAQVERGRIVYSGVCGKCHGRNGNGAGDPDQPKSPSVARASFLAKWDGQSIATLFEYIRTTMPQDNPGSRSDQEYLDAIAYMFSLSRIPVGEDELPPDSEVLAAFVIGPQPAQ